MMESRDMLFRDNVAISAHRASSRPLLAGLAEAIGMCANLDERFEKLCSQLDKSDPAKAQTLRSTALFEVRQRHTDLITQMRSEEHTSELQSLMRISYAVFCLQKKT